MNVLLAKNFDTEKLKYSELKIMKSGAKSVYINYNGNKVNLQTPVLNIPYGVNDNMQFIKKDDNRKDEERKYDVTVSFKGMDENPKIKQFHDKMKELEHKIIDDAFTNRLVWFKNNYGGNKDVVANMFTPIVKHDKDKQTGEYANKYPPTFKAKIPYNSFENKFEFDCYDMDNNETNFNDILLNLKGGKAQFIIQLSGIWFSAGMFGCSWKIVSAKFQQINTSKLTFVQDSDDENTAGGDDDDDISVDNDVIAKISQKKTLVEKPAPAVAPPVPKLVPVHKPIPQEEEDEDEEEAEDDDADTGLENVNEEEDEGDEAEADSDEEEVKVVPVKEAKAVAAVAEPVKPAETKAKKAVAKKGK
jgi:hypothetical protein